MTYYLSSKWHFYLLRYLLWQITYIKYIFHSKIQLFVTAKPNQDPDPQGSALVWLPWILIRFELDPGLHWNQCGSATLRQCIYTIGIYVRRNSRSTGFTSKLRTVQSYWHNKMVIRLNLQMQYRLALWGSSWVPRLKHPQNTVPKVLGKDMPD